MDNETQTLSVHSGQSDYSDTVTVHRAPPTYWWISVNGDFLWFSTRAISRLFRIILL
ncbi:MAG: hypothetical protein QG577_1005, partial [Thermodesulfobacteriota bacterium]|nr:hypothetical protein [Thermodesulfobacteriota bacterium]